MSGRYIQEAVKKRLYAESMGRCMNPSCQQALFHENGDIIEKAHIAPYCETADNSFENLVLLCPNCHTDFDKNHAFAPEEVLEWKKIRSEELNRFFSKKYDTFEEMKKEVAPLLAENKTIYENYYLRDNRILWDKFEGALLVNNRKLKMIFSANLDLFQRHKEKSYSNLHCVQQFIAHVDEFEATRVDKEKSRSILFPAEINSMFGIMPIEGSILPSTESLELLIEKMKDCSQFEKIELGVAHPYIQIIQEGKSVQFFLDDTPRLRQLYYDYNCFRGAKVRLESLNYALKYIRSRKVCYHFFDDSNLREISINNAKMIFVYEYCLSQTDLMQLLPEENDIIVNLHNWNGASCISHQAYELAKHMNVQLLTMTDFYEYINGIK